jgi:hypothetical protein
MAYHDLKCPMWMLECECEDKSKRAAIEAAAMLKAGEIYNQLAKKSTKDSGGVGGDDGGSLPEAA